MVVEASGPEIGSQLPRAKIVRVTRLGAYVTGQGGELFEKKKTVGSCWAAGDAAGAGVVCDAVGASWTAVHSNGKSVPDAK